MVEMITRIYQYGAGRIRFVGFKKSISDCDEQSKKSTSCARIPESVEDLQGLGRLPEHLTRSRSRVRELAFCNDWKYFLTVTVSEVNQKRDDIALLKKRWNQCLKDYAKKFGFRPAYLIIPETHHDGKSWHLHGLVSDFAQGSLVRNEHGYLDVPYFRSRFGWVSVSVIRDPERTASYIAKYITKDFQSTTASKLGTGEHLFFSSQGLRGKELLWSGDISLLYPDGFDWSYENEYCKIKEISNNLNNFYERIENYARQNEPL